MSRVVAFSLVMMLFVVTAQPQGDRFSRYKNVEAYEIHPGILMMPRYTQDGDICEIGIEGRHYSPERIRLDSGLSRLEIERIIEELVPVGTRGSRTLAFGGRDQVSI